MPKNARATTPRLNGHAFRPVPTDHSRAPSQERRSAPRSDASALPPFTAHVVDGPPVKVVNVSRTGILARSEARLMPGAVIGLRFVTADSVFTIMGKVVRSSLVGITDDIPLYESALAFTTDFPLLDDGRRPSDGRDESLDTPGESVQEPHTGTPSPFPREIGRFNGEPTVLTVTAFAEEPGDKIRKVLAIDHRAGKTR